VIVAASSDDDSGRTIADCVDVGVKVGNDIHIASVPFK
jgi:hypothetical protein